ncbi:MAG TPA: SUF system NifU family Fe-S cluster assembly protein [Haloplasmataceae bacterium]
MSFGKLETLYRAVILDHYKNPRNKGLKDDQGYIQVHLKNPSCGDDVTIGLKVENGLITDVVFEGSGCSISMSSASIMTETVKGKTIEEAQKIIDAYVHMVKGEAYDENVDLGEAVVYQGVSNFPARFNCATISWNALSQAIQQSQAMNKDHDSN